MTAIQKPELVIFDLGNVLVRINFDATLNSWAKDSGCDPELIRPNFVFDSVYEKYERGEISEHDFYLHVKKQLNIELSFEAFDNGWNALFDGEINEASQYLERLSKQAKLVLFSNTNISHRRVFSELYRHMLLHFDTLFISSEMGMRKPESRGFEHVLKHSGVEAQAALFFDDLEDNIIGARALGISAVHVSGPLSVKQALSDRNLI